MRTFFFMVWILMGCSHQSDLMKKNVQNWHYQLQNYDNLSTESLSKPYLYVLDPDELGNRSEIVELANRKGIAIAYISIGEAESYRSYFKELSKDLILYENKNWKGNFKVKFWTEEWQKIIFNQIRKIKEAGFKGIYLDIVDAFYEIKPVKKTALQMRDFLIKIHEFIDNEDFLIIQQNAPTLYTFIPEKERDQYFNSLHGLSLEDCFFYGNKEMNNELNIQDYCIESIKVFKQRNKFILSVEYLDDKEKVKRFMLEAKEHSLLPLATDRELKGKFFYRP